MSRRRPALWHGRLLDALHEALDAADRLHPLDDPRGLVRIGNALGRGGGALKALFPAPPRLLQPDDFKEGTA
ncbi:MAG TPA: hypothetical protein DEV96_00685 [Rhodospirillum rubrum]|nr:hypothetical protein [Rhodospirillum rubrum]